MTDLHSLKLKDEVLECLYSLSPISPVRDYELSFYFDTTTVQPCKNIADNGPIEVVLWTSPRKYWILEISEESGYKPLSLDIVLEEGGSSSMLFN